MTMTVSDQILWHDKSVECVHLSGSTEYTRVDRLVCNVHVKINTGEAHTHTRPIARIYWYIFVSIKISMFAPSSSSTLKYASCFTAHGWSIYTSSFVVVRSWSEWTKWAHTHRHTSIVHITSHRHTITIAMHSTRGKTCKINQSSRVESGHRTKPYNILSIDAKSFWFRVCLCVLAAAESRCLLDDFVLFRRLVAGNA